MDITRRMFREEIDPDAYAAFLAELGCETYPGLLMDEFRDTDEPSPEPSPFRQPKEPR